MIRIAVTFLLWLTLDSCHSEQNKGKQRIDRVCDQVMNELSRQRVRESIDLLRGNSIIDADKIDTLEAKLDSLVKNVFPKYGKIISFEFIKERRIKNFIARRSYILRLNKYYIKFEFTLYKSSTKWMITSFICNDEIDELMY